MAERLRTRAARNCELANIALKKAKLQPKAAPQIGAVLKAAWHLRIMKVAVPASEAPG